MLDNNPEEAIEKLGVCVILAGAGTGKTHTIVEKIKYLIQKNIYPPERVVCITFSNEAANSLLSRVQKSLELKEGKEPIVRTFHAFSADLLRKHGHKIGVKENFTILEPDDAKVILNRNLKIFPYYCHKYIEAIGTAKDLGIKLEELQNYVNKRVFELNCLDVDERLEQLQFELQTMHLKKDEENKKHITSEIRKINNTISLRKFVNAWSAYEKIKVKTGCLDYSDLNKNALSLLKQFPDIANNYDYIVVDEFQDTNKIQLDFLQLLAPHRNITVVGDLNQSIYRFRGAYKDNFNLFKKYFNVKTEDIFTLAKSRRSSNKILKLAHKLILNNYDSKDDCFFVENFEGREGDKIEVYEMKNGKEEARKIVELIKSELAKGIEMNEICVMFRTHQQGRIIRRALELENINFVSVTRGSLLKNKDIKKVVYYMTILDKLKRNKKGGEDAWWGLIYESGFPEQDLIKIGKFIKADRSNSRNKENNNQDNIDKNNNNQQRFDNNENILENNEVPISQKFFNEFSILNKLQLTDQGKMLGKILIERIKSLQEYANKDATSLITEIYKLLAGEEKENTKKELERTLNLTKFFDLARDHSTIYNSDLGSFIDYLSILDNLGIEIDSAEPEDNGIRLMTLHSTKGLEYKTVIVSNLVAKRFPIEKISPNLFIPLELSPEFSDMKHLSREELEYHYREYERKNQLLEERRLCYVAFTRAKNKLIITYANEYSGKKHYPSPFLNEIDYKANSDIVFQQDKEEKFIEKEKETKKEPQIGEFVSGIEFEKEDRTKVPLSPSALQLFDDCQKEFEYKYVYNMPEKKTISWEAMKLGSFIHLVLEEGVKSRFKTLKEFNDYAKTLHLEEEWEDVDMNEVSHMLKVFFARNKDKYNEKSKTEQYLNTKIEGINFTGYADRIDYHEDTNDKWMEIIDYKTGKTVVEPRAREWQLGYYAIAASRFGKVRKITLDMLKQDIPLEFEIDDKGNAVSVNSSLSFNIYEVKDEIIKTAKRIHEAYRLGFKPCPIEKNCDFCNEYVYNL